MNPDARENFNLRHYLRPPRLDGRGGHPIRCLTAWTGNHTVNLTGDWPHWQPNAKPHGVATPVDRETRTDGKAPRWSKTAQMYCANMVPPLSGVMNSLVLQLQSQSPDTAQTDAGQ